MVSLVFSNSHFAKLELNTELNKAVNLFKGSSTPRSLSVVECSPCNVSLQFPSLLNGPIPVSLPSMDAPSPLLLSSSSHKSWWHQEHWAGANQTELGRISTEGNLSLRFCRWTTKGARLPPEADVILIWHLLLYIGDKKKQELHSEVLMSNFHLRLLQLNLCHFPCSEYINLCDKHLDHQGN